MYFKNDILHEYVYWTGKDRFNYAEHYDSTSQLIETFGSPITNYAYCKDSAENITLQIEYFLLNKEVLKASIKSRGDSSTIQIYKLENKKNLYYSHIFLAKQNSQTIKDGHYEIHTEIKNCSGKIEKYKDTLLFRKLL